MGLIAELNGPRLFCQLRETFGGEACNYDAAQSQSEQQQLAVGLGDGVGTAVVACAAGCPSAALAAATWVEVNVPGIASVLGIGGSALLQRGTLD
ncbi:MAG: hypothetical protein RLN70_08230, partial [Rhodospirillaceae bacterium]